MESRGRKKWNILKDIIKNKKVSLNRWLYMNLFDKQQKQNNVIYTYDGTTIELELKQTEIEFKTVQQIGINEVDFTGLSIWPCQELMAYYCLRQIDDFNNKSIIELGAGFQGFSGLFLAKRRIDSIGKVVLTDGNSNCIEYLQKNITKNGLEQKIEAIKLYWNDDGDNQQQQLASKFDCVLVCECLYIIGAQKDLYEQIKLVMRRDTGSFCWIFSPARGKSIENFKQIVEQDDEMVMSIQSIDQVDDEYLVKEFDQMKQKEEFDCDVDHFYIIQLKFKQ